MSYNKSKDLNFSQAIGRLEEIVQKLESPNLDLEEGMKLLAEGLGLHKRCQTKLKNAQIQIDKLLTETEKA